LIQLRFIDPTGDGLAKNDLNQANLFGSESFDVLHTGNGIKCSCPGGLLSTGQGLENAEFFVAKMGNQSFSIFTLEQSNHAISSHCIALKLFQHEHCRLLE
jgi:hypothetical protein